jgi:dihydrofolate synthase/folylpolyglutamate synthase
MNNVAYEQTLDYLYSLINFEMKRHDRYMESKLDASRPQRLMASLGSPHQKFHSIHIAGTKGKGSVAAICASSLRAAGLKVGLYTSPHVIDFRERIRILTREDEAGLIPEEDLIALVEALKPIIETTPGITWFEVVTAIAFTYFAQQQVDVAVVEVGLGGRLDATNVLSPLVSVITSLSYDHTEFLGDTLDQIAAEKGGIIKPGVPVVTAPQPDEALERLLSIAVEQDSPISIVGRNWMYSGRKLNGTAGKQALIIRHSPWPSFIPEGSAFRLALAGAHQLENAVVALAALSLVHSHFPTLTLQAIAQGMDSVKWIGRLQTLIHGLDTPTVLVDCAHNADSARKLREALTDEYEYKRLWLILGTTIGKDVIGIMQELLPMTAATVATHSSHPRANSPDELVRQGAELGYDLIRSYSVSDALLTAWKMAEPGDLICVTGSIFVVGDLLNEWERLQSRLLGEPVFS